MQRGSSVNFQPLTSAIHAVSHASRTAPPTYLLPPEESLGTIVVLDDFGTVSKNLELKMSLASRQALKVPGYSSMWEGVLNLRRPEPKEDTERYKKECAEVVKKWCDTYEETTGHKVLRADVHLDEGYIVEGVTMLNAHAHIIADKTNEQGRVIKLTPQKLRDLQTVTAEITGLERGVNSRISGKKHITAHQYKYLAERGQLESQSQIADLKTAHSLELDAQKAETARMHSLSKEWSDADLDKIKDLKTKLDEVQTEAKKVPDLVAQLEGEPARLEAALAAQGEKYMLDRATMKQENADALAAGLAKMHSQKDYQDLKTTHLGEIETLTKAHADDVAMLKAKHAEALADLKTELARAAQQAAKVPSLEAKATGLQAQIAQLTPLAEQVPDLKTKLDGEPERLRLALVAEAAAAGLDKPISQKDYSDLKKAYEAALAEAAKVPALAEQVKTLKPQADKVQGLEKDLTTAQAQITQLKEQYRLDRQALKESGEATQASYQTLKKDFEAELAKAKDEAQTAKSAEIQATTKVTELVATVVALKPKADRVHGLEQDLVRVQGEAAKVPELVKKLEASEEKLVKLEVRHEAFKVKANEKIAGIITEAKENALLTAAAAKVPEQPMAEMKSRLAQAARAKDTPPSPVEVPVGPSLAERVVASLAAMLGWIAALGGTQEPIREGLPHLGAVVHMDDLHAIQKAGRRFAIHRLDDLDVLPDMNNLKTEIRYREGKGEVFNNGPVRERERER